MKKLLILFTMVISLCVCAIGLTGCHSHELTKHDAVAVSCETDGSSEYYSCECGKFFADAEAKTEIAENSWVIEKTGHDMGEYVYNNDATCLQDGTETSTCANGCGHTDSRAKAGTMLSHDCDNTGLCSICEEVQSDEFMANEGYVAKTKGVYYESIADAVAVSGAKVVYVIGDTDENVSVSNILIVKKGVNYTGTATTPNAVEIDADLEVYAGSFSLAWTYYSYFSPDTKAVTIKLLDNITFNKQQMVNRGTALTLDLNGYDVTSTANAYTRLFLIKDAFTITSSKEGSSIDLAVSSFAQLSSDYTDCTLNVSNVQINQTEKASTDFILNYGSVVIENTEINVVGGKIFNLYGNLTLGEGTLVNVSGVLGTSLMNLSKKCVVTIDGATIDIAGFKVNGGGLFSMAAECSLIIEDINLTVVVDETYPASFIYKPRPCTVELKAGTYNVSGASGKYTINADGTWTKPTV